MISKHLPFKEVVFLGSLTHSPEHNPVAIMRSAFDEACEWVGRMTVQGLATPLLTGGWRLKPVDVLHRMLAVAGPSERRSPHRHPRQSALRNGPAHRRLACRR